MRYIDLLVRDHPEMDQKWAVLENCPSDFGFCEWDPPCIGGPANVACRACWEREVPEA